MLDEAYFVWIKFCKNTFLSSKLELYIRKQLTNTYILQKCYIKDNNVEGISVNMHKIKLAREAREMMRIEHIRRIKNEFNNYNLDDYMLPHLTIKVKELLFTISKPIFEAIREYQNVAVKLFDRSEDGNLIITFHQIHYNEAQKHISNKFGQKKKACNAFRTFIIMKSM
jgi:hypothetical protein